MLKRTVKIPIAVLIGGGSKLPNLIKASRSRSSKFKIVLVISHKSFSPGVNFAVKNKIPAIYFKLPDFRNRLNINAKNTKNEYMQTLGWLISQREYAPKLLVFAGWDLVMDQNFFSFFKSKIGNGYAAINLHPALMPYKQEKEIIAPDGSKIPLIKGEQYEVLKTVIKLKHQYFGPSIHFMVADDFDTGEVIERAFIKAPSKVSIKSLRKKLMPEEDRILISAINKICKNL